jgi:hypothetical protein
MTVSASRCASNDVRSPDPPLTAPPAALAPPASALRQGDCIALSSKLAVEGQEDDGQELCGEPGSSEPVAPQLYQVIGVDAPGNRCWLRRWPLARHGSPVFELPLGQLEPPSSHRPPSHQPRP